MPGPITPGIKPVDAPVVGKRLVELEMEIATLRAELFGAQAG